ncbi:hypothetical protein PHISP_05381 [Aspergillus sp. HF37]|nr:hypothetical protein PHISP_05381 [Aspergillus sp. HF37]
MSDSFACLKSNPCGDSKSRKLPSIVSPTPYASCARRPIGRSASDDAGSFSANIAHHPASPTSAVKKQFSMGAELDPCISAPQKFDGSPEAKGTPHVAPGARPRRQPQKGWRRRSGNAPGRLVSQPSGGSGIGKGIPAGERDWSSPDPADDRGADDEPSRPPSERMAVCSSVGSSRAGESPAGNHTPQAEPQHGSTPGPGRTEASGEGTSGAAGGTQHPGLLRSPETYSITEAQLNNEVRKIYAGLEMVESKAIEFYQQYVESREDLSAPQWRALIALHRTLLQEHHDFYLASLHPSASAPVKQLAEKYSMPTRMWRYGIHLFLDMLYRRLPDTLEHMTTFIYIAYSMLTLLLETVPKFEQTWIECLGDLARYRMALEKVDLHERELWAGISRYWFNNAADKAPGLGRIQHHLAILARPDAVQQLFYYTKSLVSVHDFPSARESILLLFKSLLGNSKLHYDPAVAAFVCAHGQLFTRQVSNELVLLVDYFISTLDKHIGRMGAAFKLQGVYIMSSHFAALFEYGHADALVPAGLDKSTEPPKSRISQSDCETPTSRLKEIEADLQTYRDSPRSLLIPSSYFAFETFAVVLNQIGDTNVYPALHVTLAFIWCLSRNCDAIKQVEMMVPWAGVARFLNTMVRYDTDTSVIEHEQLPASLWKQVPEDFCLRGQAWSGLYYPPDFFGNSLTEEDGRWIEVPSLDVYRAYRCFWLAGRIAALHRWIEYDPESRGFTTTPFAKELEKLARRFYPFNATAASTPTENGTQIPNT